MPDLIRIEDGTYTGAHSRFPLGVMLEVVIAAASSSRRSRMH
ncbi:MAG TPA: hypothetical protein VJ863_02315 [Sphaerochaeta sp.]|nr:hypothetical protein [Sphaerochaeta sp.]